MSELKQRTWQLRDFISWEKFANLSDITVNKKDEGLRKNNL
jgi:hypothetical protein